VREIEDRGYGYHCEGCNDTPTAEQIGLYLKHTRPREDGGLPLDLFAYLRLIVGPPTAIADDTLIALGFFGNSDFYYGLKDTIGKPWARPAQTMLDLYKERLQPNMKIAQNYHRPRVEEGTPM
jgi:hypothetical protein